MTTIDRRTLLTTMVAAVGAGCASPPGPGSPPANATPEAAAVPGGPAMPGSETKVVGRMGALIKLEGLIAYSVLRDGGRDLEVDAILVDATRTRELALHAHIPTIAIPRDVLDSHALPAAVDIDYAYWPIAGKTLIFSPVSVKAETVTFDHASPTIVAPTGNEEWRSTGWLADMDTLYKGHKVGSYQPAATVRFAAGAEFEPTGIVYGEVDKANGVWELFDDSGKRVDGRAYKHSLHAFYQDPQGVSIDGLLPNGQKLIVPLSKEITRSIRILHLPARAMSKAEIEQARDARAYADLLTPAVPVSQRLYPKWVVKAWRTDECGCCPQFRTIRDKVSTAASR